MSPYHLRATSCLAVVSGLLAGCLLSPKYHVPSAETPVEYKELTPADFSSTDGWKVAQPRDNQLRGKWWKIFNDPQLDALEEKVDISNQTIVAAAENYFAARALVKEARSQLFPTLTTSPALTRERLSSTLTPGGMGGTSSPTFTDYLLPFDVTWQPDFFGRIRETVRSAAYGAQASAADLEVSRLTVQVDVATDYFQLRGQDSLKFLLDSTVIAFQVSFDLTKALYETGIGAEEAVAQAETQLKATQAQDTALGIQRAEFEHAIAMLTGQPASTFSIPFETLKSSPPAIPFGFPSQLLERRPDIAAAERFVARPTHRLALRERHTFRRSP